MKKSYILFVTAMVAALTVVSCKCSSNKTESQEPTQEEVQEMKQALADSVLAEIDTLADIFIQESEKDFFFADFELTEEEKIVKPNYLLDPAAANNLVTKYQKVNALAIYIVEYYIRLIYDMPVEKSKEVIAKLAAEVNHPTYSEDYEKLSRVERLKKEYEICKENGDLAYFWQFYNAVIFESEHLIAQNPQLFISKITDEQISTFRKKATARYQSIRILAQYDDEAAEIYEFAKKNRMTSNTEEAIRIFATAESAQQYFISNKDKFIARRNALIE